MRVARRPPRTHDTSSTLTVTQLATLLRAALEREVGQVLVAGEVSNLRRAPSGHAYFTLKDDRCQVRCVMFRSSVQSLVFTPADGQEVIVRGQVSVYPARGEMQLYVETMEPQGRGALQLAFEQLKARLAAEGLFAEERKRPLPFFPRSIGIATAVGGAALRDILVVLHERHPGLHVVVCSARVQGEGAADDLVRAIRALNAHPGLEVLIVGRGGGSLEDLWPFNEERVARAILASRLPVISAVGHEVDVTIADLVADRRAPTPTAAAEIVVPRVADLAATVARGTAALVASIDRLATREHRRVDDLGRRLRDPRRTLLERRLRIEGLTVRATQALRARLDMARTAVDGARHRVHLQDPRTRAAGLAAHLDAVERRLQLATGHALQQAQGRVARAAAALDDLSPLAVLQRGYSLTRTMPDRAVVRDAAAVAPGDQVEIRFAVGRALARIEGGGRDDTT